MFLIHQNQYIPHVTWGLDIIGHVIKNITEFHKNINIIYLVFFSKKMKINSIMYLTR